MIFKIRSFFIRLLAGKALVILNAQVNVPENFVGDGIYLDGKGDFIVCGNNLDMRDGPILIERLT